MKVVSELSVLACDFTMPPDSLSRVSKVSPVACKGRNFATFHDKHLSASAFRLALHWLFALQRVTTFYVSGRDLHSGLSIFYRMLQCCSHALLFLLTLTPLNGVTAIAMFFCSCCRDVQSAGSTSELPGGEDKCSASQAGHADVNAGANGGASLNAASPTVQLHGEAGGTTSNASDHRGAAVTSSRDLPRSGTPSKGAAPVVAPLTLQQSDKARRTSAPVAGTLAAGAYLMYGKENDTLYCQWSTTPQPEALAWLMPVVQIPGHKYNVNKGKQVLVRECVKTGKYFQGWINYIKLAREYPSKLMLLDNFKTSGAPPARIFLLEIPPDQAGVSYAREVSETNKLYDLIKNVKAVAAVPASATLLTPDEAIDTKAFVQRGSGVGAAMALGA